ncbi:MAG: VWA domain-containing protein [Acidobacteriota bacterium]
MRRRERNTDGFSLSFLDCICCGFGALILLLVLLKVGEPTAREVSLREVEGIIQKLEEELHVIRGESEILNRELRGQREQLSVEQVLVARLRGDLTRIQGEFAASQELSEVADLLEGRLVAAQQELTDEMKRLQRQAKPKKRDEALVGGIPVDSEYVIFIIDTSGSMKSRAWPLVEEKMREVLLAYPKVKGLQVMNDMGQYMFGYYAGKWIPDTPARRKAVLERLRSWSAFSNSSPVEGVTKAIRTFGSGNKRISIYVFGDEFSGSSADEVLKTIDRANKRDSQGRRRVRIHAVGFPTVFTAGGSGHTGVRFALLMRALCSENDGTFVALNSTQS